jgi:hypothetical protein
VRAPSSRAVASPAQIFTTVLTDGLFRDGALEIADHHAACGTPPTSTAPPSATR